MLGSFNALVDTFVTKAGDILFGGTKKESSYVSNLRFQIAYIVLHSIWFIRDLAFDFSTGNLLFLPKFQYSRLLDVSYFLGFRYQWNLDLADLAIQEYTKL